MTETPARAAAKTEPHEERAYFMVTCHGWSGSHWLACALNLHKDITCGHSARNLLATHAIYDGDELKESTNDRQQSRQNRGQRPLDDYYDELEEMGDTLAYGNVHTFRLRDLPVQAQSHPVQRPVSILNMVRHPVSLVNSGFGQLREMIEYDIYSLIDVVQSIHNFRDFFVDVGERHSLNLCDRKIFCFLGAAYHLVFLGADLKAAPAIQHIVMEKVTSEPAYFESVVRSLTGEKVAVDQAYLDEVYAMGAVNSHRVGSRKTPAERYAAWQPWQREAFRYCLDKSEIQAAYSALGYDFSFL